MSIDVWAHVAIFTHFNCIWTRCGLCKILGQVAVKPVKILNLNFLDKNGAKW